MPEAATIAPATATQEQSNVPAAPVTPNQENAFADAFASLDTLGVEDGTPSPAPAAPAAKPAEPAKPAERPRDPVTKQFVKADEKPKEPAKPAPKPAQTPEKPKPEANGDFDHTKAAPAELRSAYEKNKARLAAIEKEYADFKAKSSQPDPERQKLTETNAQYQKRMQELEEKLKYTNYAASDEYKQKYHQPFLDSYRDGENLTTTLKVVERKNEEGEIIQQSRKATVDDFEALMAIRDHNDAADFAEELFGNRAPIILNQRQEILRLNALQHKAVEDYKKRGEEISKAEAKQQEDNDRIFKETWEKAHNHALEKFPQYFKPAEDDPRTAELLEKGFRESERAFFPNSPLKEGEKPLAGQGLIALQRAVYNRSAAFPRLTYDLSKAQARIAELEEQLKGYEHSEPKGGDGNGRPQQEMPSDNWEQSFDKAAEKWG